jgi:hypothetical protein
MKKLILAIVLALNTGAYAQLPSDPKDLVTYLQEASVTVKSGNSSGTGVVIKKGENSFILSAGHVVDGLRHVRKIIDPTTGSERSLIEFDEAEVIQLHFEGERIVGKTTMTAEVIHYSDSEHNDDIAVLHVRQKNFGARSIVFAPRDRATHLGDEVKHVGSFLGEGGANSYSEGKVSQVGRILLGDKVFHQLNLTAFPGSSGGATTYGDGHYMGMLVRGHDPGFVYITPASRIHDWAARNKFEWLLNNDEMPPLKDVLNKPIEDTGLSL